MTLAMQRCQHKRISFSAANAILCSCFHGSKVAGMQGAHEGMQGAQEGTMKAGTRAPMQKKFILHSLCAMSSYEHKPAFKLHTTPLLS